MKKLLPGIAYALLISVIAVFLGKLVPMVGAPVFGIVLGILAGNILGRPQSTAAGLGFTSKKVLQASIVLLGAGLSFSQIFKVGMESFSVMVFTISAAFIVAYIFKKILGTDFHITSLIAMGTAICGASAIAAISPIIEADDQDISYSISTVFFFNVFAVLVFPALGHLLGLSDSAFGLWAGTAINDTSSVVAAGYAYSDASGAYATIVKLTRTTMIIPISLIFSGAMYWKKRKASNGKENVNYRLGRIIPWFVLFFLAASLMNTAGVLGTYLPKQITEAGKYLIVVALSAVGLNSNFRKILQTGFKPMLLGMVIWIGVACVSLIVQFASGMV